MKIEKIYKFSVIILFIGITLFRIQIFYSNKVEKLDNQIVQGILVNSMLNHSLNYMKDIKKKMINPIYEWPIHIDDYKEITSEFGYRILHNPFTGGNEDGLHKGLDLTGTSHARVVAVADGIVIDNYYPPGNGWNGHPILGGMIKIQHEDGRTSIYGHLSITYVNETNKKIVKTGDVIGRIGNTGVSYGEHLHFELHDENDQAIQSLFYLKDPNYY